MHQLRSYRAVYATADRTDDSAFLSTYVTNPLNFLANKCFLQIWGYLSSCRIL
jgi:hypothetical protein